MRPRLFHQVILWLAFLLTAGNGFAQSISSFDPDHGEPGREVHIHGSGFFSATQVHFSQANALFQIISAGEILAIVPTNATSGPIYVNLATTGSSWFYVAPRITDFSPVVCTVGQPLIINGANFFKYNNISYTYAQFGSVTVLVPAASITSDTQINMQIPAGATTGPLVIFTFAGTNYSKTNLVVGNGLVVTGFNPPSGATNSEVILDGGDFTGVTNVTFNGTRAVSNYVTAPNQLHVFVPPGATTGPIGVSKLGASSVSSSNFVVTGLAPIVTGFTPPSGKPGDPPVVITGVNFTTATSVTFNGTNAAFSITSDTQISATIPAVVTTGPVHVINPYGEGVSASNFLTGPIITQFAPASGKVNDAINIFGDNLLTVTNVLFGGIAAAFTNLANNQITALVPPGATNAPISIIGVGVTNTTTSNFTVIAGVPVITSFTPSSGFASDRVEIDGVNFYGATAVTFNGVAAIFDYTSDSQIFATVPAAATTGPISVTGPGGTGTSTNWFYLPPRLTSFSPANGIVGTTVTIQGTNFAGTTAVEFTGSNAIPVGANFTYNSNAPGQLLATVPTNALTGPLRVTAPGGVILSTNWFSVLPKIVSFAPLLGPAGTAVTISGNGFNSVTAVRFNGTAATFTNVSTTQINAAAPAGAGDGVLTVTTTDGSSTSDAAFIVTVTADLSLRLTNSPSIGTLGEPLTYSLVVTNRGPDIATSVLLSNTLPVNATFVSATGTLGSVTQAGNVLMWRVDALTNNRAATLTVVVVPTNGVSLLTQAGVSAAESDPTPGDLTASLNTPLVTVAQRSLLIRRLPVNDSVEISWPVSGVNFVLQNAVALALTNPPWLDLTNPVARLTNGNGIFNALTNETTDGQQFFRLRSP